MQAAGRLERIGRVAYLGYCAGVLVFLIAPILVILPLSFNAEPYFTFTEGMLRFDPEAWSMRWYREVVTDEAWTGALANSLIIGTAATALATLLGTLAALGLSSPHMPARRLVMGFLISPLVTPVIIAAAGMFFFYTRLGLGQTHLGLILAHAVLGTPFVVITVTATLAGVEQRTIPRQMWAGIRENISPAILAVAAFLIVFALCLLWTVAWLRKRSSG